MLDQVLDNVLMMTFLSHNHFLYISLYEKYINLLCLYSFSIKKGVRDFFGFNNGTIPHQNREKKRK